MSRKRKALPLVENFEISDVVAEGMSIGRWNDLVVFVPFGAPGDVVDLQLTRKKHSYAEGRIVRMVSPSPTRVTPFCEHFGVCGGCKWQHLPYADQLRFKQRQVEDALRRIAKVDIPTVCPIIGSENTRHYRNKLEFAFSNKCWLTTEQLNSSEAFDDRNALGFHIPGCFDKVLNIKRCWLQDNISNDIRLFVRDYAAARGYSFYDIRNNSGLMRNLMVRTSNTGQVMVVVVFGADDREAIEDVLNAIARHFEQITSLMYVVNLKCNDSLSDQQVLLHSGAGYIVEQMENLRFRVGPKSFYQTNSAQAYELYKVTRDMAGLIGSELVYDLYTGTGTIANFVAHRARWVIGIEYVVEAIDDARLNAQVNNLENTEFYAGDMKDVLTDDFVRAHGRPEVMIIDPPRAGMHPDVVDVILRTRPDRIVYVSCNPATQARDIALLDAKYRVERLQPVDMFPHTHHVENVALLVCRKQKNNIV